MIYGSPTTAINHRKQVYRFGRYFSSATAADRYAQKQTEIGKKELPSTIHLRGIVQWLKER